MGNGILLGCGVAAGPLFTVAYLVEGVARPGYDSLRHPISSLAIGRGGWTQRVNFLVTGLLSLAFAAGLWRDGWSHGGAVLLGLWAAGLLGAGVFLTDPVGGFPPGTPDKLPHPTRAGALHDLCSLAAFLGLTAACAVLAFSGPAWWTAYSLASGLLFAATMALSGVAFDQHARWAHRGGLIQRASLTLAWTWHTALALRALHG